MSELESTPPSRNSKAAIWTAVVTAASGIAIAFVGVLPQLPVSAQPSGGDDSGVVWDLEGTVTNTGGNTGNSRQILLVPREYWTFTDDAGNFSFEKVEKGSYRIVVRIPGEASIAIGSVRVDEECCETSELKTMKVFYSANKRTAESSGEAQ